MAKSGAIKGGVRFNNAPKTGRRPVDLSVKLAEVRATRKAAFEVLLGTLESKGMANIPTDDFKFIERLVIESGLPIMYRTDPKGTVLVVFGGRRAA